MSDTKRRKTLVLDFDGVIHSYSSGWISATFIPDPPVDGAFEFIYTALKHFDIRILSSRSHQDGGIHAMQEWMRYWAPRQLTNDDPDYIANAVINQICLNKAVWVTEKPPAHVTLDDRAITFTGEWPSIDSLLEFKPWNKKGATD